MNNAANTTLTKHDLGNNESWVTGIAKDEDGWTAMTFTQSKTFKTRGGAERWLAARGYAADGSKVSR